MRLDLGIQAGDNTKKFLTELATIADRFEKVVRALRSPDELKAADADDAATSDEDTEELAPKKKRGRPAKATKGFDDEDTAEEAEDAEEAKEEDEEEELSTKSQKGKKVANGFDEDADADSEEQDEEADDEEEEKPAKAATKSKKVTLDDVNDACKAAAQRLKSRDKVLAILQKKFSVTSVTKLKETQYAEVIKAMAGK